MTILIFETYITSFNKIDRNLIIVFLLKKQVRSKAKPLWTNTNSLGNYLKTKRSKEEREMELLLLHLFIRSTILVFGDRSEARIHHCVRTKLIHTSETWVVRSISIRAIESSEIRESSSFPKERPDTYTTTNLSSRSGFRSKSFSCSASAVVSFFKRSLRRSRLAFSSWRGISALVSSLFFSHFDLMEANCNTLEPF